MDIDIETIINFTVILIIVIVIYKNFIQEKDSLNEKDIGKINKDTMLINYNYNTNGNELMPVNVDDDEYSKTWTDSQISHNSKYHTSKVDNEKVNIGKLFNNKNNNQYVDITSPESKVYLPDRCILKDGRIFCNFNDKLQVKPTKLIDDPEKNNVIVTIKNDRNIYTNYIDENEYLKDKNENVNNGGYYFKNVKGYSDKEKEYKVTMECKYDKKI